jgi:RES domain-containing protein
MLEREDRGYAPLEKFVCVNCVQDEYLKRLIRKNLSDSSCAYCHSPTRKATPVASIQSAIASALFRHYSDTTHAGCSFDREAPEPHTYSTADALTDLPLECHDDLLEDLANAFHNGQWVEAPNNGLYMDSQANEEWAWSWDGFSQTVKHETRFHFGQKSKSTRQTSLLSPSEILPFVGELIRKHRMHRTITENMPVYRARHRPVDADWPLNEKELGAPPPKKARAGRMNPAGIPYFYTAFEESTAIAEISPLVPFNVAISTWKTARELHVVDLTKFNIPSVFDESKRLARQQALFLCHFLKDIRRPIFKNDTECKDDTEHIEYVPTQVVSEYLAQVFTFADGSPADGLIYPSAVLRNGLNLVLFRRKNTSKKIFDQIEFTDAEKLSFPDWDSLADKLNPQTPPTPPSSFSSRPLQSGGCVRR